MALPFHNGGVLFFRSWEQLRCQGTACGSDAQGTRASRLGVLFLALVLAGVFAGVGHAGEIAGAEEAVNSTSSSSDVIAEPLQPEAPAEESSGTSPGDGVPADQTTSTETPSDTTGGEAPSSQTPTETPPPEPTESPTPEPTESPTPEPTESPTPEPTETPPPEPTESPPPEPTESPTPEPTDTPPETLPTETAPVEDAPQKTPTTPVLCGDAGEALIILGIASASSEVLGRLPVTGSASTKSRETGLADNDARSMKAVDPLPGRSPASSGSSGASTGSASGGSGGGLVLPAEFLMAPLVMLRYTFRLSFALPHSRAFALRQERPG
jgi:hypothetical protein